MRDKIKPGVYAILSAVALCISGRFSVIIGGWAKLAAELSGEKEQAFVIVILLMILPSASRPMPTGVAAMPTATLSGARQSA